MKLYATTTSERASKGQGGNKNLLVVITAEIDGQRQEIAHMDIMESVDKKHYVFDYSLPDTKKGAIKISKGKSQKGECLKCGTENNFHNSQYCDDCGAILKN